MPIQISSEEINAAQVTGYVKSLGFNIFYGGTTGRFNTVVFWDKDTGGDLKDFLRVAKSEGVRLIIIDWDELEEDDIEDFITPIVVEDIPDEEKRRRISNRNQRLEALKNNVGKAGAITVRWVRDNTEYVYISKNKVVG